MASNLISRLLLNTKLNNGLNIKSSCRRFLQTRSVKSLLDLKDDSDLLFNETANSTSYESVRVVGWVKSIRNQKELKFIHLNDGSDGRNLQLVIIMDQLNAADQQEIQHLFDKLNFNSSLEAIGKLVKSSHKKQAYELRVEKMELIGSCKAENYPFQAKVRYNFDQLRPFINMRTHVDLFASVMRFRSQLTMDFHDFFYRNNFFQVHTPIITTNNCEGGCETFEVVTNENYKQQQLPSPQPSNNDAKETNLMSAKKSSSFFSAQSYLTASAQLHLEMMTSTLGKVYTLSPAFRAEKSMTKHHLAEFYMLEAEAVDMRDLDQLIDLTESMVKDVSLNALAKFEKSDLDRIHFAAEDNANNKRSSSSAKTQLPQLTKNYHEFLLDILANRKFIRITYREGIDILNSIVIKKDHQHQPMKFGDDFSKEQEKKLVNYFNQTPVFIKQYPKSLKPFYMRVSDLDPDLVENFDLLVPKVGEIVGGSLREYRLEILKEAMVSRQNLNLQDYQSYLETKEFASMKLGGFGLGLERFIQFLLNIENIRDTTAFPRYLYNCKM